VITLNYQFKLKLNQQQIQEVEHILAICKSVYNYALAERKHWVNSRKSPVDRCSLFSEYIISADVPYPNYNNQAKNLTIAKKTSPNLKSVNANVVSFISRLTKMVLLKNALAVVIIQARSI
jgi:putative transposase